MKLQVGKTYLNRRGEKVTIAGFFENRDYPYQDNNNDIYTEHGCYFDTEISSPNDLISEYIEQDFDPRDFDLIALPRKLMYVSDDGKDWYKRFVVGKRNDKFVSFYGVDSEKRLKDYTIFSSWEYCKPLPEQLTKAQIAQLLNRNINSFEIVEDEL